MNWRPVTAALFCLFTTWPAQAHDLQHSVAAAPAVVIQLVYMGDTPFAFEAYEIYREGEKLPYQVGRTDRQGRIAFLPDRADAWRVKAFSEDGHGIDFKLETDAAAVPVLGEKPAYERYARIAVGVALILGLFSLISLYTKKRKPK